MGRKAQLLKELNDVRKDLWVVLDGLDADFRIYTDWTKREFYAHVSGWDALVYDAFRSYRTGVPRREFLYTDMDQVAYYFVSIRKSLPLADAKLECEINRAAVLAWIDTFTDSELGARVTFPWGEESVEQWLIGAIDHEREHLADIQRLPGK